MAGAGTTPFNFRPVHNTSKYHDKASFSPNNTCHEALNLFTDFCWQMIEWYDRMSFLIMEEVIATIESKAFEGSELKLSCVGLSSVNWDRGDDEFEFVFGDNRVCRVHSVLAEFLSPKVGRLRKSDALCGSYTFKSDCHELLEVFESLIASLRSGQSLRVEKANISALVRISHELENQEVLSSIFGMIKTESLDIEESILMLRVGIGLGTASSGQFSTLKDTISSRFHEISKEILAKLDLETAELLLSSRSLQIESEDSLYDFVRSRSEEDMSFASLFEFILFEYLSEDRIKDFASFACENLLPHINPGIWSRVCERLILTAKVEKKNPRFINRSSNRGAPTRHDFVYNSSAPLQGIIAHLTERFAGNVDDKGIVEVTASSVYASNYERKNAVDLGTDSQFSSKNEPNSWIRYDFKERRVAPTSYSVRTHSGSEYPKSWVFEASNDGKNWTVLDCRDNNDLKGAHVTRNFTISSTGENFQFIQFRQTGKNHGNNDYLHVTSLEIFGILSEK